MSDEVELGRPPCPHCGRPAVTRGMCSRHYLRWWRNGDPLASKPRRGRPKKTPPPRKNLHIYLPLAVYERAVLIAKRQGKTLTRYIVDKLVEP